MTAPHVNRDAITGKFVTDEVAQVRPETTVRETVREDRAHITVKAWLDCAIANLNDTDEKDLSSRINRADDAIRAALDVLGVQA